MNVVVREKPWWQTIPVEEFKQRVEEMGIDERQALVAEMNGVMARIGALVQDSDATDPHRRNRARRAMSYVTQKRGILVAVMHRDNEIATQRMAAERKAIVEDARGRLEAGDVEGALRLVLVWIDGFGRRS